MSGQAAIPDGEVDGGFEHINRIEAMRNRLAAGETTFTLDELKLTLAWADHLNYFLAGEKRISKEATTRIAALEKRVGETEDELETRCRQLSTALLAVDEPRTRVAMLGAQLARLQQSGVCR